ncbi:MAG: PfkB family carbohydrate kinase [Saprospiraceae bacterium]
MQKIDFLAIGHVCHDWTPSGNVLGGTTSYASFFAREINLQTAILTSFGSDFEFQDRFQNISLHSIPSDQTTFFKNIYDGSHRQQFLLEKANNILTSYIPKNFQQPKMVLLGPIANEIDLGILDAFKDSMIAVCPQGWMRRWNSDGKVFHKMIDDWTVFKKADMVILSEEDLDFQMDLIPQLAALFKILVVTKGENGADIFLHNNKHTFPSFPSKMIDPTGAGDIFATAFLIRFFETNDISQAANFANAAASFCIEKKGIQGIVSRKEIIKRAFEIQKK